jgi:hypothetical protein
MSVNDGSAPRQFVASSPTMSAQMNAFATGRGARALQGAFFALIVVAVVMFATGRSQYSVILVGGLVALAIFGLAGTAYVWWRSRREVLISVTGDGLTVNRHAGQVFSLADGQLGPWVQMGVALHLKSGSRRFVLGGRDRRITPAIQVDGPPVQTVDAWLWAAEFDELLAVGGPRADLRGPAPGQPTRCLLFPNPYAAETVSPYAIRKQLALTRSLSKPSLVLDLDNDATRLIDPNDDALSLSASDAEVTATPATFQPASVTSGDGGTHNYPATAGLIVNVPGAQPLTIGCLDLVGSEFRFTWSGDVSRVNDRPAYVFSGGDWLALVDKFGLASQSHDRRPKPTG